jgi:hypothetical protein
MSGGYLYFIANRKLRARKIGVTRKIESLSDRYTREWEILSVIYHPDWQVVSRAEQMALAVIRSKWGYRQRLSSKELAKGATETFGSWFWPTNRKINSIIDECVKLSQASRRMKER